MFAKKRVAKKHILVISQYFYPEQFRINDICLEWVKRGYKVTVVTGIPNYPEGKFYKGYGYNKKRVERWNGMSIIRLPLIPRGNNSVKLVMNYLSFTISEYFWHLACKVRPDFIFMFETSPMTQCNLGVWLKKKYAKKGIHIPLYAYIQDLWPENVEIVTGIHHPVVIRPIERMVQFIYRNCDHIFTTSPSFVNEIVKRDINPEKIHYWPQYAEEFYHPVSEEKISQNLLHNVFDNDAFKIMFTGNIGKAQGLDILANVANILKEKNMNVHFYIVGGGRDRENFESQIESNHVNDMFSFLGKRDAKEIPELLACADVAFLSFMNNDLWAKTIPAKLQSYMACGKPILASARGESVRIVKEADCGMYSDIGDVNGLVNNIIRFCESDKELLNQYGENARNYFLNHFEKQNLMDQFEKYLGKNT